MGVMWRRLNRLALVLGGVAILGPGLVMLTGCEAGTGAPVTREANPGRRSWHG
jgi:hypothetical protein